MLATTPRPQALLLLGDTAYMHPDGVGETEWQHDELEKKFTEQFKLPEFRAVTNAMPVLPIWDDHDFGINDAKGGETQLRHLAQTAERYFRHMDSLPTNVNRGGLDVFFAHDIGEVRFIMLDVRSYREDIQRGQDAQLLGRRQEAWLMEQLDHNLKYTVVASGS